MCLLSRLVLHQADIDGFRATKIRQCKTQSAGNGQSKDCNTAMAPWVTPFGQGNKRPSALLHSFELAMASPALVRLAAERFSSCCTHQYQPDGVLGAFRTWH